MVDESRHPNIASLPRTKLERLRTGFAILGAPISWALHFSIMYFLVQPVCRLGGDVWFHIVTAIFLVLTIAAGLVAWRHRSSDAKFEHMVEGVGGWGSFVALFGVVSAALFAYAIIYQWAPVLTHSACEGIRTLR